MKKVFSIILAVLMVFSLASCGNKKTTDIPDAKALYLEAYKEDITSFSIDMVTEISLTSQKESASLMLGLEGDVDKDMNINAGFRLEEKNSGVDYKGETYIMLKDSQIYLKLMGMWFCADSKDLENVLGESVSSTLDMDKYKDVVKMPQAVTDEKLENMGFEFTEVTEEDGKYLFGIRFTDKSLEYFKLLISQSNENLTEDDMKTIDELFEKSDFAEMLKSIEITVGIDKKTGTLCLMNIDATTFINEAIKYIGQLAAEEDPSVSVEDVKISKIALNIEISDLNKIDSIEVPANVKKNAMSILDILQLIGNLG